MSVLHVVHIGRKLGGGDEAVLVQGGGAVRDAEIAGVDEGAVVHQPFHSFHGGIRILDGGGNVFLPGLLGLLPDCFIFLPGCFIFLPGCFGIFAFIFGGLPVFFRRVPFSLGFLPYGFPCPASVLSGGSFIFIQDALFLVALPGFLRVPPLCLVFRERFLKVFQGFGELPVCQHDFRERAELVCGFNVPVVNYGCADAHVEFHGGDDVFFTGFRIPVPVKNDFGL